MATQPNDSSPTGAGLLIARQFITTLIFIVIIAVSLTYLFAQPPTPTPSARATIVLIWQGMRPDMVNATLTPRLFDYSAGGVVAQDHHAVFPTTALVNAAALATGDYPGAFAATAATTPASLPGDGLPSDAPAWLFAAPPPASVSLAPAPSATPSAKVTATATPSAKVTATATPSAKVTATATPSATTTTPTAAPSATATAAPATLSQPAAQIAAQRALTGGLITAPSLADLALEHGVAVTYEGMGGAGLIQALGAVATSQNNLSVVERGYTYPAALAEHIASVPISVPDATASGTALGAYLTTVYINALLPTLEAHGAPFLSVIAYPDPAATAATAGLGAPATLSAIQADDQDLGQIIDALRNQHQFGNVNIIITSDAGLNATLAPGATSAARQTFTAPTPALRTDLAARLTAEAAKGPSGMLPDLGAQGVTTGAITPSATLAVTLTGAAGAMVVPDTPATRALGKGSLNVATGILIPEVTRFLQTQADIGPIFLSDGLGAVAGTLPLSAIALAGPRQPDLAFAFAANPTDIANQTGNDLGLTGSIFAGTDALAASGGFDRHSLHTIFVAGGPSFKQHASDPAPTGAIDLAPTLAKILGLPALTTSAGRSLDELLVNGPDSIPNVTTTSQVSAKAVGTDGRATLEVVDLEQVGATLYLNDAAASHAPATTSVSALQQMAETLAGQE